MNRKLSPHSLVRSVETDSAQPAVRAERAVLAAMMLENRGIERARAVLDAAAFNEVRHQRFFTAILALADRGESADLITVSEELRRCGHLSAVGGAAYVAGVFEEATTSANIEAHARIVLEYAEKRRLITLGLELQQRAGDPYASASEIRETASRELSATSSGQRSGNRRRARITRLADVHALPVTWVWQSRIPRGMVTILDGDPGLGKSTVMLDVAARLSRGDAMPDGSSGPEAAGVVILTAEDDLARVVRPRLDAAGADTWRIATLEVEREGALTLPTVCGNDLCAVEAAIQEVRAGLVIIDPLVAFLPDDLNANHDQDVRRALALLRSLAEQTGAAVVAIRHLNKRIGPGNPLYRGGGSIGIIGAARSGLVLARDPDDATSEGRVLAVTKANLAPPAPALGLRLVVDHGALCPRVVWEGVSSHTSASLLAPPEGPEQRREAEQARSALAEAEDVLRGLLADGPLPAVHVEREARAAGVSVASLRRAKQVLGVRALKVGGPIQAQHWEWALPREHQHPEQLREHAGHKLLPGAETPEGAQDPVRDQSTLEPERLRLSDELCVTSELEKARRDEGAQRAQLLRSETTCPACGGRVLTWSFGSVCTNCHLLVTGSRENSPPIATAGGAL